MSPPVLRIFSPLSSIRQETILALSPTLLGNIKPPLRTRSEEKPPPLMWLPMRDSLVHEVPFPFPPYPLFPLFQTVSQRQTHGDTPSRFFGTFTVSLPLDLRWI